MSFRLRPANPFATNYTFNTGNTASYQFDPLVIQFTESGALLIAPAQVDQNDSATEFGGGTARGVTWDGTNSSIRLNQSGLVTNYAELDSSWAPAWGNIVGYWPMENNWNDAANSNNGVPSGTVAFSSSAVKLGSYSGAFTDAGSIQLGNIMPNSYTKVAWIYVTGTGEDNNILSGTSGDSSLDTALWLGGSDVGCGGSAGLRLSAGHNDTWGQVCDTADLSLNTWYHVAVTYDAPSTTLTLYKNGAVIATNTGVSAASQYGAEIGGYSSGSYFTGNIDEVALWNVALTPTQIRAIYDRQFSRSAGTFTSRVLDADSGGQIWTALSWTPTLPFLKELPDAGVSESQSSYSSLFSSSLMNGISGLWHLDETVTGSGGAGEDFKDNSGQNNWGTLVGGVTPGIPGKLGSAVSFDGTSGSIQLPAGVAPVVDQLKPFSLQAWVQTSSSNVMEIISSINPSLGSMGMEWTLNQDGGMGLQFINSYPAHYFYAYTSGPTHIVDGQWHHLVVTSDGTLANSGVQFYVDGVAQTINAGITNTSTGASTSSNAPTLGSRTNSAYFLAGALDEVALWARVLQPAEISQLYRRGANRIGFQVRSCAEAACADDPSGASWKGPDNSNQTYFSELNNTLTDAVGGTVEAALPFMDFTKFVIADGFSENLAVPTNRYFQYRAILDSNDLGTSCNYGAGATWCTPELKSVTAGPAHYDNSGATLSNTTPQSYTTLSQFTETLGTVGCPSGAAYNLSKDNSNWYFWDGSNWAIANGTTTQANAAGVINANISSFPKQVGTGSLYFRAFLQSSGLSPCELGQISIAGTN